MVPSDFELVVLAPQVSRHPTHCIVVGMCSVRNCAAVQHCSTLVIAYLGPWGRELYLLPQLLLMLMLMLLRLNLLRLLLQEPELTAWQGASAFAAGDNYWQCVRTKQQYEEQGGGRRDR